jgi:hypothetical protein
MSRMGHWLRLLAKPLIWFSEHAIGLDEQRIAGTCNSRYAGKKW